MVVQSSEGGREGHTGRPPVIIIGMHRSGTSMVTRMLEELGLFVGEKKMSDHEPYFFLGLNDWVLRQCGGAWDRPEPVDDLLENKEVRPLVTDYLRQIMKTPRAVSYLGWKGYLRHRTPQKVDIPWGWKDPRNTYTLPLWLDLFPEAKVVHIYRHGVDVASSLKVREEKVVARAKALHQKRNALLYGLYPKRGGFAGSLRCASLGDGFTLWESYLARARQHVTVLGDRALEFRYEDFLVEPGEYLSKLADFCGLSTTKDAIANVSARVNKDRAYPYRRDPELRTFAGRVAERLEACGYLSV